MSYNIIVEWIEAHELQKRVFNPNQESDAEYFVQMLLQSDLTVVSHYREEVQ